jgi:hypothetical protein
LAREEGAIRHEGREYRLARPLEDENLGRSKDASHAISFTNTELVAVRTLFCASPGGGATHDSFPAEITELYQGAY